MRTHRGSVSSEPHQPVPLLTEMRLKRPFSLSLFLPRHAHGSIRYSALAAAAVFDPPTPTGIAPAATAAAEEDRSGSGALGSLRFIPLPFPFPPSISRQEGMGGGSQAAASAAAASGTGGAVGVRRGAARAGQLMRT